jgi:hypothetical protein
MSHPPEQGKSGSYLTQLLESYLKQYSATEGDVESQIIVAAYNSVNALTALSKILDRDSRYRELIDQRSLIFKEAGKQARIYSDCLLSAAFSIYNTMNTLCHQLTEGNDQAALLIQTIDEQVHQNVDFKEALARPAAAMRACFPLLGLITIASDEHQVMTDAIRHVEQRYSAAAKAAKTDLDHLVNALYRLVEMFQIFALLTDADLKDQIDQIASTFKEEDRIKDLQFKVRNGFCRLFELSHLLASQVDLLV